VYQSLKHDDFGTKTEEQYFAVEYTNAKDEIVRVLASALQELPAKLEIMLSRLLICVIIFQYEI